VLALLEQLGVQADAGIHQEDALVDSPDLHRAHARAQQRVHGITQVFGNAVGAAEIIEGALGQHAEWAAGPHRLVRHRVQGAVAAGRHQDAALLARTRRHPAGGGAGSGRVVHDLEVAAPSGALQHLADGRAAQVGFGASGPGVEHHQERRVGARFGHLHAGQASTVELKSPPA
jgi:hypothetical protein